ncbi:MAG: MATE family efflux transporter [Clostridia bacterium]|nr:MATE family efflux transporter [Clostridia bacterium]
MLLLLLPIVLQNVITASVGMADTVMLGRVDQQSLAASSLAGQVQFLLNVTYFGLASALTILAAQYWGKGDGATISRILGIGLILSLLFSGTAALFALSMPERVMRVWTNEQELIETGAKYLRLVAFSYLFAGFSQPYLAVMKSCGRVLLSTVISFITLGLNVMLNAVLIFGLFGCPQMGIQGAALATSISRGVELMICLGDYLMQSIIPRGFMALFHIPGALIRDFARYCLPAFINDALWGLAISVNAMIMGHLGSDIVAANSVVSVVRELVTTVGFGISAASSIMLGREIGVGDTALAERDAAAILQVTIVTGIVGGALLIGISPLVPGLVKISATSAVYLKWMLRINAVYQMGQIVNTLLISSFFRCGGDASYGLKLDFISMWCYTVPVGLIAAFVLRLSPLLVYVVMCTDEFVKMPFAMAHYKKRQWIKNLTRNFEEHELPNQEE